MEKIIMTPSGSSARLKFRLRNAANNPLKRSKSRQNSKNHKNSRGFTRNPQNSKRAATNFISDQRTILQSGNFIGEVHNAVSDRLGHRPHHHHIPGEIVEAVFNDMHLYPSKSEVSEMLQCARQCGRRKGTSPFLTFGEFCVFAREMQKPKSCRKSQHHKSNTRSSKRYEVFLGGSCNPTTWRTDIAIPELQKHGISFYNPQKSMWRPELVAEEHDAKQSACVLLYVVDSQTRSVGGMIEVAYLVASNRCVVLVAHPYKRDQSIMGEKITDKEYTDLVDAQTTLLSLVGNQGVKIHASLSSALQATADLLRDRHVEDQVTQQLRKLRRVFDAYDRNNTEQLHLEEVLEAYNRFTNKTLKTSDLYNYFAIDDKCDSSKVRISFEQFCGLVSELNCEECGDVGGSDSGGTTSCDASHEPTITNRRSERVTYSYDIFLGGSCKEKSNWRERIALPRVRNCGLSYYNPAAAAIIGGSDEANQLRLLQWKEIMDKSKVLLIYISDQVRSLTSMILAAHYIGKAEQSNNMVLCIQNLPNEECEIESEQLTQQAIKDYNRGRVYLSDLAKRKSIPVFENITHAVEYSISICLPT